MSEHETNKTHMSQEPGEHHVRIPKPDATFLAWAASVLNAAFVILGLLTALAGVGAWYLTSTLSAAKEAALTKFKDVSAAAIAGADARAAEANKAAAEAGAKAAIAGSEAAVANERTKVIEFEAAKQRERAANAERLLLELQQRIQPRLLSGTQKEVLLKALLEASPRGAVEVVSVFGDGEGRGFAAQIHDVLKLAGWPVTDDVPQVAFVSPGQQNPIGLLLGVKSVAAVPQHAVSLQRAFAAAGMPIPGVNRPQLPADRAEVIVGNKPQ